MHAFKFKVNYLSSNLSLGKYQSRWYLQQKISKISTAFPVQALKKWGG